MVPLEVAAVSWQLFTHGAGLQCFGIGTVSTSPKDQEPFCPKYYEISMAHTAAALLAQTDQTDSIQHFWAISQESLTIPPNYDWTLLPVTAFKNTADCLSDAYPFTGKSLQMINQAHCHAMLSSVWLFETLWTVAHQASLSMEFSRQEHWRVGCHTLLQGIFLTQGSKLCLLHWQADSLPLSPSPLILSISCKIKSLENKA